MAFEKATKVMPAILQYPKEYVCLMHLHGEVSDNELLKALKEFTGPIYQRPPLRSSVKRRLRIRKIFYIEMLERENRDVLLKIGCESGTYARKLCHDIGLVLGVGAHMQELRRTKVGPFVEDETLATLQDLIDAFYLWKVDGIEKCIRLFIQPVEKVVEGLPKVVIRDSAVDAICHGAYLAAPGVLQVDTGIKVNDLIAILTLKGELVALAKALMRTEEIIISQKGIVAKPISVVMEPGTYPRMWKLSK